MESYLDREKNVREVREYLALIVRSVRRWLEEKNPTDRDVFKVAHSLGMLYHNIGRCDEKFWHMGKQMAKSINNIEYKHSVQDEFDMRSGVYSCFDPDPEEGGEGESIKKD